MKNPNSISGNPALNDLDPSNLCDLEKWAKAYIRDFPPKGALIRFNISVYQVGQVLRSGTRTSLFRPEGVGAAILHALASIAEVKGGVAHLLPKDITKISTEMKENRPWMSNGSSSQILLALTEIIQQLFYRENAPKKSVRKKRYDKAQLEELMAEYISHICGLVKGTKIPKGIETAAAILMTRAYEE